MIQQPTAVYKPLKNNSVCCTLHVKQEMENVHQMMNKQDVTKAQNGINIQV